MNKNILKVLIPIIAVVVLVESVLLISGLQKRGQQPEVTTGGETNKFREVGPPVYDINIAADKEELKVGGKTSMTVTMKGDSARSVDSISIYVKYDPEAFDVPKLTFDKKLPAPAFSKVSTTRGMLVANFLISDANGLSLEAGEELALLTYEATAKKAGNFTFEISTGNEMKESATMIVENKTSKVLPFSSNKLTVKVSE